jgi:magnesium-transporting ATPase (P-type)
MKNSASSRVKVSCNEKMLNRQIMYIFCLQLGLCLFGAIYGTLVEKANITESLSYLEIQQEYSTLRMNYFVWCIIKLGSRILMFTYFIPISLVVTIEFVRLFQGQFITYDVEMFDQENGMPAKVQTSNLNDELGMVS